MTRFVHLNTWDPTTCLSESATTAPAPATRPVPRLVQEPPRNTQPGNRAQRRAAKRAKRRGRA